MTLLGNKKSRPAAIAALVLSGIFAGIIIGPISLYATGGAQYNPVTEQDEAEALNASFSPGAGSAEGLKAESAAAAAGEKSAAQTAAETARKNQADEMAASLRCFSLSGINLNACVAGIMDMVMWLAARTLWIAGVFLNITLHYTLNLDTLLERLPIVDIGWKVLRDIANIIFIFITLWAGISITLGLGDGGKKAWGLLAQMVLVALFINFSLFITKAVVDASNIAALHFYSLIVEPGKEKDFDKGLSEAFIYGLKISTLYNVKEIGEGTFTGGEGGTGSVISSVGKAGNLGKLSFTNIILIGFFGSLFIIVAAWVLFSAAIMFIYRAITLIMLMLLSPLAFVGLILPGASGMAHQWWSKLWSQAFFAPLYLALTYIVVRTINSGTFKSIAGGDNPAGFAAAITGTAASNAVVIFNFVILIGLMVACLVVAQSLGAKGSDMAMAGWERIKGVAVGGTTGLIGRTAVRGIHFKEDGLVAKAGTGIANRLGLQADSKWGKRLRTLGGRELLSTRKLNEVWEKSRLGQTALGKFAREQTTGRLTAATFGGSKTAEQAYEEHEEMTTRRRDIEYGKTATQNANGLRQLRPEQQALQEKKLRAEEDLAQREKDYAAAKVANVPQSVLDTLRNNIATARGQLDNAGKQIEGFDSKNGANIAKYTRAMSEALAKMSTEGFLNQQKTFFTQPEVMDVEVLGADKYNALMASEHFTEPEKSEYTHARLHRINEEATRGEGRIKMFNEAWPRFAKAQEEFKKAVEGIEVKLVLPNLRADLETNEAALLAEQQKTGGGDATEITKLQGLSTALRDQILQAEQDRDKEIDTRIKAGTLEKPEPPKQPKWDTDELRKALRNMRGTEELTNWYRHSRDTLNKKQLVATVMQGNWNEMRKSDKIDSAFKEQFRVDKRFYIQDAADYTLGLHANVMDAWEKIDMYAANALRKELNDQMIALGEEKYKQRYFEGKDSKTGAQLAVGDTDSGTGEKITADNIDLNAILKAKMTAPLSAKKDATGKPIVLTDYASADERKLRSNAGVAEYEAVAPNLATNEFTMMPGILRKQYAVLKHLDHGTTAPFDERDIEDTQPMAEFFIEEFKRTLESKGKEKISVGNLLNLKWIVNEDRGQRFARPESIREDLKPTFEIIKGLIATTARSLKSAQYADAKEAVAALQQMYPGAKNPFDQIQSPRRK